LPLWDTSNGVNKSKTEMHKLHKIAILGPESTGKSKVATRLSEHFNAGFVPEYSREYFHGREYKYNIDDLVSIGRGQIENENVIADQSQNMLICDTELITISVWSQIVFNKVPSYITEMIQKSSYNLFLLCNLDVEWTADPLRRNEHNRQYIYNLFVKELERYNFNYRIVAGIGDERLKNAVNFVDEYLRNG